MLTALPHHPSWAQILLQVKVSYMFQPNREIQTKVLAGQCKLLQPSASSSVIMGPESVSFMQKYRHFPIIPRAGLVSIKQINVTCGCWIMCHLVWCASRFVVGFWGICSDFCSQFWVAGCTCWFIILELWVWAELLALIIFNSESEAE